MFWEKEREGMLVIRMEKRGRGGGGMRGGVHYCIAADEGEYGILWW